MFDDSATHSLVGCEIDKNFFIESVKALVEMYATQYLNPEADNSGNKNVLDVWKLMVCGIHGGKTTKRIGT